LFIGPSSARLEHVDGLLPVLELVPCTGAIRAAAYKRRFSSISIKDRTGLNKARQERYDCNPCSLARLEHVDGLLRVLELVPALEHLAAGLLEELDGPLARGLPLGEARERLRERGDGGGEVRQGGPDLGSGTDRAQIGHRSGTDRAQIGHRSDTDRAQIGHRSDTDRTQIGHRSDTDRAQIGHRSDTDRTQIGHRSGTDRTQIGHRSDTDRTQIGPGLGTRHSRPGTGQANRDTAGQGQDRQIETQQVRDRTGK
jgi:hypothetical protein